MKKTGTEFDITKQHLWVYEENFYLDTGRDVFVSLYEYDFNPDEYFGTSINEPNGEACLCFLTEWDIATDDITMYYYGDFKENNGRSELTKKLTENEKEFFRRFMDKYSLKKYGRNISNLHYPMSDEERFFFFTFDNPDRTEAEVDEDVDKGIYGDTEDKENEEFDIKVNMLIHLPETDTPDIDTAMADITAAFACVDIKDWLMNAESWMDDDNNNIEIKFVTYLMDSGDGTDIENFCIKSLEEAEKELNAAGYRIADISCTVIES